MSEPPPISGAAPPPLPKRGVASTEFATASLITGIVGIFVSFMVIGMLCGLVAIILGFAHLLRRGRNRVRAGFGIATGVIGIAASSAALVGYLKLAGFFGAMIEDQQVDLFYWEGVRAPDFVLTDVQGNRVELSDFEGRRVVLAIVQAEFSSATFTQSTTGPLHQPWMRLAADTGDDVQVICLVASPAFALKLTNEEDSDAIIASVVDNTRIARPYNMIDLGSTTFIIDRNGVIQSVLHNVRNLETLKSAALADDFEGTPRETPPSVDEPLEWTDDPLEGRMAWSFSSETLLSGVFSIDWDQDGHDDLMTFDEDGDLFLMDFEGNSQAVEHWSEEIIPGDAVRFSDGELRVLGYKYRDDYSTTLVVVDASGKKVWEDTFFDDLNSVAWADLDGNGNPALLYAESSDGRLTARSRTKTLWRTSIARTVWSVAGADLGSGPVIVALYNSQRYRILDQHGEDVESISLIERDLWDVSVLSDENGLTEQLLFHADAHFAAHTPEGDLAWWGSLPNSDHISWNVVDSGDFDNDGNNEWVVMVVGYTDGEDYEDERRTFQSIYLINVNGRIIGYYELLEDAQWVASLNVVDGSDLVCIHISDRIEAITFSEP